LSAAGWVDIYSPVVLLIFHKPYGVLCQFTPDQPGQKTLADFGFPKEVYPVGRLDMDSEGLLLLCDEPGFNHRFLDPEQGHPRAYWVQVEGLPDESAVNRLKSGGLEIQGHKTRPCRVELMKNEPNVPPRDPPVRFRKSIPTSWLRIELVEGKNRQVRRMTAAVGYPTLRLIRCAIGGLEEIQLNQGEWIELSTEERKSLTSKD
jgi:23S rRNA pseudouridine2457 synthase